MKFRGQWLLRKIAGFVLVVASVFSWFMLNAWRWDYIVHVVYPGEGLGEPIWVYDPGFFILISFFCGVLTLIGLLVIFSALERDYYTYRTKRKAS